MKNAKILKLDRQHLEERHRWLNHPNIHKDMNMQCPITLIETERWFEKVVTNSSRIDLVFEDENNTLSMTGITNIDTINGIAEFYIMVNPDLQGKGIGFASTVSTINYAFSNFNIHKIYLYTNSFNKRANNLYTNVGFSLEGTLKKHKFKNGDFIDRSIYGLLKEDWERTPFYKKYL